MKSNYLLLIRLAIVVFAFAYFYKGTHSRPIDFKNDVLLAQAAWQSGVFRPNGLFYAMAGLLGGGSPDFSRLAFGATLVLSFAVWAKFEWLRQTLEHTGWALASLFVFSLPVGWQHWYLGQFPPNIWHNSTVIMVFPFALWLFALALRYAENPSLKLAWLLFAAASLNVLIKPSFFFCAVCVFPVFWYKTARFNAALCGSLALLLPALYVLFSAFWLFAPESAAKTQLSGTDGGIAIAPFAVWSHYSRFWPVSLLLSVPFVLCCFAFSFRSFWADVRIQLSLALFAVGLLIAVLFSETGARQWHGNFMWQTAICNLLLHVACLRHLRQNLHICTHRQKQFLWGVFGLQTACGVAYVLRFWVTGVFQ